MPAGTDASARVRFGVFELELRTGELRRTGALLRLSPQPLKVLLLLVSRPGQLITRDEFRREVWGNDTFVDFEHGLNFAIKTIRDTLGDDAERPRYIETLPRRGYRFIAPVEWLALESNSAATGRGEEESATGADSGINFGAGKIAHWASGAGTKIWLAAGGILAIAASFGAWNWLRPLPIPTVTAYTQITHDGWRKMLVGADGRNVYFDHPAVQAIYVAPLSTGRPTPIRIALPAPYLWDVSPDGSTLLVASLQDQPSLWTVQQPGGVLHRLIEGDAFGRFSPDGKSLIYIAANRDIKIVGIDGTGDHTILPAKDYVKNNDVNQDIALSPDGGRIRFTRDSQYWEMTSAGTGLHPLFPNWPVPGIQCCGRWTPDGNFFIFTTLDPHYRWSLQVPADQLWITDERKRLFGKSTLELRSLAPGPIRWGNPIPAPDGKKIYARGVILRGELVRFDHPTGQMKPYLGGMSSEMLDFSRDGNFVVYVSYPEGILWIANRDGSRPVRLSNPPMYPTSPRFSPDGKQIVFIDSNSEKNSEKKMQIYVVSAQGGEPHLLLPGYKDSQVDPNWSPDGRQIVFCSLSGWKIQNWTIQILDLDTRQIRQVPQSAYSWSPRWSPDGRYIAALDLKDNGGLKLFDMRTQRWSMLTTKGDLDFPTFSRGGKYLYFVVNGDAPQPEDYKAIERIRMPAGRPERVVDLTGFRFTGMGTLWMGLDPDDTPLLFRDVGNDDIYALTLETK